MYIALWIINAVVALSFLLFGSLKLLRARDALVKSGMAWVEDFPTIAVRLIGTAEVLGAAGVVLPLLLDIAPILAPVAATALTALMIGAIAVHVRRKEPATAAIGSAVLSAASAVIGFLVVLG